MAERRRDQTTVRGVLTVDGEEDAKTWGIRWLFPDWSRPTTWLGADPIVLGRDEACDVILDGEQISRRHAQILRQGVIARLRDLDSKNGVFVDGNRVSETVVIPGSLLRIGEWIGLLCQGHPDEEEGFGPVGPGYWGSDTLKRALQPARRAAASELPIILQGETGTGKEGAARAVHAWSGRKGAFLAVNCSVLPEALAEGQLFGYRKGAFTGADTANVGYFRAAEGGTLLLDEIADLPAALQPKLLRALEQKEVHTLGEPRPSQVDVRILAAAQQPLAQLVEEKRMRADLVARLEGLIIELPPLRERREDVPPLFKTLVEKHARSTGQPVPALEIKLVEQLCLYDWPFNIRELDLLVRRLMALHGHEPLLRRSNLPESIREAGTRRSRPSMPAPHEPAAPITPQSFVQALRDHSGNVARAAAALGISRQKAYRLMQAHGNVDLDAMRESDDDPGPNDS